MPTIDKRLKHVMIVTSGLGAGGAEQVIAQLAWHFVEAGHEVDVVAFDGEADRIYHALPPQAVVTRLQGRTGFAGMAGRVLALRSLLARRRPDVVISFLTKINLIAALAVQGRDIRLICAERNNPEHQQLNPVWNHALRWFYRRAEAIICQTAGVRRCFPKAVQERLVTIPNPVAEPDFKPGDVATNTVCAVGRLTYQKGFDRLIDAFASIAAQHPRWRLMIWGEGPDRPALEARIRASGMEGRIVLRGLGERPRSWIGEADVFVLSSRYEGFPNALAEAMAAGLPVIATRCDFGPADMVCDGDSGLLVDAEDCESLGQALAQLLGDADLRSRLAQGAQCAMLRYRPGYVLRQWDEVLAYPPGSDAPGHPEPAAQVARPGARAEALVQAQ